MITEQQKLQAMLANIDSMSEAELREVEELIDELDKRTKREACRRDLIEFCRYMQADYKVGAHHRRLANLLMDIEQRRKDRICVSVPPRHGKSQMVSIYYAAWYLGLNPTHKVMLVSHTADLAVDFGRKVRNLIASDLYQEVFPGVTLAADSKSAGRWSTNHGGEFFAAGVGAALAGRGAHLLLVDDPHSEQDVLAGNFDVFEKAYQWFAYGARTRLMPGGAVAIVHCMTGDTGVLRPDGTETPLAELRPGDMVMSYDGQGLVPKKVLNWANQGEDDVFNVVMEDGNVVSGNARHPFLVVEGDTEKWVKLGELAPGMEIRAFVADATSQNTHGSCASTTTIARGGASMESRSPLVQVAGVNFEAQSAQYPGVMSQRVPESGVCSTTTNLCTPSSEPRALTTTVRPPETLTCETGMVLDSLNTTRCSTNRGTDAPSAGSAPMQQIAPSLGTKTTPSPLTTATIPTGFEDFSATGVTSCSETTETLILTVERQSTLRVVKEIVPAGREDVFDIEVEDNHNFIAHGNVVSNTRWHQDDLIGRVVRDMTQNKGADEYEVFEFPAILESVNEGGEVVKKALWPEFFDLPALERTKASMPTFQWNAQYQQNPTGEEAAIVKREWWNIWTKDRPPPCEYVIMSLDAAAEAKNRSDFTALTTWGVFVNEEPDSPHRGEYAIILLNSIKERLEFPELKKLAMEEYKTWEPDAFIVEKKSSGTALYQEMRRSGLIVQEYTPHRGTGDKMARLNSVADIVASGLCWVPQTRWAEEVVEEIAGFPFLSNDDLVDSSVMALMRFRQGGFIRLPSDEWDEVDTYRYREPVNYY